MYTYMHDYEKQKRNAVHTAMRSTPRATSALRWWITRWDRSIWALQFANSTKRQCRLCVHANEREYTFSRENWN